jgi:hypothetical protein
MAQLAKSGAATLQQKDNRSCMRSGPVDGSILNIYTSSTGDGGVSGKEGAEEGQRWEGPEWESAFGQ